MTCEGLESLAYWIGLACGLQDIRAFKYDERRFSEGWSAPMKPLFAEGYADAPDDSGEA